MKTSLHNSVWISAPGNEAPALAKAFSVSDGQPLSATLRIAAPGFYEAWLDGSRVGDAVLDPAADHPGKYHSVPDTPRKRTLLEGFARGSASALTWNAPGDRTHPAPKGARFYASLFLGEIHRLSIPVSALFRNEPAQ